MKMSSAGYVVFFGSIILLGVAAAEKLSWIGIISVVGFLIGIVLVVLGDIKEGRKDVVIKAVVFSLAMALMYLLGK